MYKPIGLGAGGAAAGGAAAAGATGGFGGGAGSGAGSLAFTGFDIAAAVIAGVLLIVVGLAVCRLALLRRQPIPADEGTAQ